MIKKRNSGFLLGCCFLITLLACYRKTDQVYAGAYRDAPVNTIAFIGLTPVPATGNIGDRVSFKIAGLDSVAQYRNATTFFINGVQAVIDSIRVADSLLTVIVPDFASSGAAKLVVNNRNFYGPVFNVSGKAVFDSTFNVVGKNESGANILGTGVNGAVRALYSKKYATSEYLFLAGDFTTWNSEASYRPNQNSYYNGTSLFRYLTVLDPLTGLFRNDLTIGNGPNGRLLGICELSQYPGYLIYGGFSSYNGRGSGGINNITRVLEDGKLDSLVRNVYNPDPNIVENNMDTLPVFTGGFDNVVIRAFIDARGRIICIGGFNNYYLSDYSLSTAKSVYKIGTPMKQIAALSQTGLLDTSYSYEPRSPVDGTNGSITGAVQLYNGTAPNGKIIVVGNFTSYNGMGANRIFMLDDHGNIDTRFNIGAGANAAISGITYNPVTRKILITGAFTVFNGTSTPFGLVMLNEDGSVDPFFRLGNMVQAASNRGQLVNYAAQLSDGKVIVSGSFEKYTNPDASIAITRRGFMILNPDGTLTPGYNSLGAFNGQILDMLETKTVSGIRSVILAGSFSLFDNKPVANIAKMVLYP